MCSAERFLGVRGNVQDSVSAAEGFRVAAVGSRGLLFGGQVAGGRAGARPSGGGRAEAAAGVTGGPRWLSLRALSDMLGKQGFLLGCPSSKSWRSKLFGGGQMRIMASRSIIGPESNFYRYAVNAGGLYLNHVELMASKTN